MHVVVEQNKQLKSADGMFYKTPESLDLLTVTGQAGRGAKNSAGIG